MQGKSQYLRVAYDQLNAGAVEKYVREEKFAEFYTAAAAFKKDPKLVPFEIGKGPDERLMPVEAGRTLAVTTGIASVFRDLPTDTFPRGKLKPVNEAMVHFCPPLALVIFSSESER